MEKTRIPASGEAAAISGYQAQYEYSACRIFYFMREGMLAAVSLANPDSGILDDLVIISEGIAYSRRVLQGNREKLGLQALVAFEIHWFRRTAAPTLRSSFNP